MPANAAINAATLTQKLKHIRQHLCQDETRLCAEIADLKQACQNTEFEYITAELHDLFRDFKYDQIEECIALILDDLEERKAPSPV